MAPLSDDDVRHIAKLCRLHLTEDEVQKFAPELSAILSFVDTLSEVDTKDTVPTPQPTGLTNSLREDVILEGGPTPEELLGTSPLPIVDHQIQTPSAHG